MKLIKNIQLISPRRRTENSVSRRIFQRISGTIEPHLTLNDLVIEDAINKPGKTAARTGLRHIFLATQYFNSFENYKTSPSPRTSRAGHRQQAVGDPVRRICSEKGGFVAVARDCNNRYCSSLYLRILYLVQHTVYLSVYLLS